MSQEALRIQKISGHAGTVPGEDTQREYTVCKLIDTTTCIGCKACEVACMEWNDLPFGETVFDNTYQTMPETRWNYWNLILFNEHEREDGTLMWLMRKNQCMHCAEPGASRRVPRTAPSCNIPMASSISSKPIASAAAIASRDAPSTFRR